MERELMEKYHEYINANGLENMMIQTSEYFICSLYQEEDTGVIGVLEFSLDDQVKSEAKNSQDDIVFMPLKGKKANHIGLKFNKDPEIIKNVSVKTGNEEIKLEINGDEEGYADTYLTQIDFDPEDVNNVTAFDKNDKEVSNFKR